MEQEEDAVENNVENNDTTETEEKKDDTDEQIVEDTQSENDSQTVQNEDNDVEQIDEKETPIDVVEEELESKRPSMETIDILPNRIAESTDTFELQEIQQPDLQNMELEEIEKDTKEEKEESIAELEETGEEGEMEEGEEVEESGEQTEEIPQEANIGGKESIYVGERRSISYDMGPRIRDVEENQNVANDFLIPEEDVPLKFYKYMDEKDEEEEEEEIESEEEEIAIDRAPYYERHDHIQAEIESQKIKNYILQKKLAKFYKRRKMEHVLKETYHQFDTVDKYGKKLDAYGELTELDTFQRTTITNELNNLKAARESTSNELTKLFNDLQIQEKDIGYGLIHTKTGNPIPDKLVERLVQRQKNQMQTVGDMRLKHIKLKNMVAEKQNEISQLDKIGEDLYLMDYEQLKVENRSYMDKMEEKDDELGRLRNKCQKTIQILAHMREKSSALESDICDLTDDLACFNVKSMWVGIINYKNYKRNIYRIRVKQKIYTTSNILNNASTNIFF